MERRPGHCRASMTFWLVAIIYLVGYRHHRVLCLSDFSIASLTVNGNQIVNSPDQDTNNEQFLGRCLECICEASSGCQTRSRRCESYYCGPYQLSYTYWADAGAITPQRRAPSRLGPHQLYGVSLAASPRDFEQCALDRACSARTVRNYFLKYAKDCDQDARITCIDMAAIHRAGADVCNADWLYRTKFWSAFSRSPCYLASSTNSSSTSTSSTRQPAPNGRASLRVIPAPSSSSIATTSTASRQTGNEARPLVVATRSSGASSFVSRINFDFDNSAEPGTSLQLSPVDQQCSQCICEAQSNCDMSNKNCQYGQVCGPFAITQGYWRDASRPGDDWLSCTRTRQCSELALKNYMEVYRRDCDNDGQITCADYAAIHHLGASACTQMASYLANGDQFFYRFNQCRARQTAPNATTSNSTSSSTNTNTNTNTNNDSDNNDNINNNNNNDNNNDSTGNFRLTPPERFAGATIDQEPPRRPAPATPIDRAGDTTPNSGAVPLRSLTNTLEWPVVQPEAMSSIPQPPRRLAVATQSQPPSRRLEAPTSSTTSTTPTSAGGDDITIEFETHDLYSSTRRRLNDPSAPSGSSEPDETLAYVVRNASGVVRAASQDEAYSRIPTPNPIDAIPGAGETLGPAPSPGPATSTSPSPSLGTSTSTTANLGLFDDDNFAPSSPIYPPEPPAILVLSTNTNSDEDNTNTNNNSNSNNDNSENTTINSDNDNPAGQPTITSTSNSLDSNRPDNLRDADPLEGAAATTTTTTASFATASTPSSGWLPRGNTFFWPTPSNQPASTSFSTTFSSRSPPLPTTRISAAPPRIVSTLAATAPAPAPVPVPVPRPAPVPVPVPRPPVVSPIRPISSSSTTTATASTTTTSTTTSTTSTTPRPPTVPARVLEPEAPSTLSRARSSGPLVSEVAFFAPEDPLSAGGADISRRSEPVAARVRSPASSSSFETIPLDEPVGFNETAIGLVPPPTRIDPRPDRRLLANRAQSKKITTECFECICEASTSCDLKSRCQTSDVKRTRCGMYLISYDQWLESGLSKSLTSPEALLRDPSADERAFYDCVTNQGCAERVMNLYMEKRLRDCDGDGRINCYDVAAIHRAGPTQCHSEEFLETQYWGDFNACYGFNQAFKRRRRRRR